MDYKTSAADVALAGGYVGVPEPGTLGVFGTRFVRFAALLRQRIQQLTRERLNTTCTPCHDEISVRLGDRPLRAEAWAKRTTADYEGPPRRCSVCTERMGTAA